MSVKVKLEKNGYIKNGFTGFSWTTIFFGFWVPLFRLKLKAAQQNRLHCFFLLYLIPKAIRA